MRTAGPAWRVCAAGLAVLVLFSGPGVVVAEAQEVNVRGLYSATRDALIVRQAEGIIRQAVLRRSAVRFGLRFLGWVGLAVLAYELAEDAYRQLREAQRTVEPARRGWLWNGQDIAEDYSGPVGTRCRIVGPYWYMYRYQARLDGWVAGMWVYGNGSSPAAAMADLMYNVGVAVRTGDWPAYCWGTEPASEPQPYEVPERVRYPWPGLPPGPDPADDMPAEVSEAAARPEWVSTGVEQMVAQRMADRMSDALVQYPESMTLGDAARTGVSWEPTPTSEQLQGGGDGAEDPATRGEQEVQTGLLQEILRRLAELVELVTGLPRAIADAVVEGLERLLVPRPEVLHEAGARARQAVERKAPWGLIAEAKRLADEIGGIGGAGCSWQVGTYQYAGASVTIDASPVVCPVAGLVRATVLAVVVVGFAWWCYSTFAPRFSL